MKLNLNPDETLDVHFSKDDLPMSLYFLRSFQLSGEEEQRRIAILKILEEHLCRETSTVH